jgi:DNA polymerase-3 subunit gamma/tau
MSYLVLARKYRPKNFTELVGQPHVVQALTNALTQQRLHHAYLFTGTRGVGKTTISRILAKSLNCEQGITAVPCGVCENCLAIDMGRFVDYTELDAASNRGVEEVQNLIEQAVYKPVSGRFKVFMIDEVHMLSNHAFNAILKTLEEPPEYLKFVLATTDPQKVPVTVLSRCLQFNLRPMAPETILEHLQHVLDLEHIVAQKSALFSLARAARGSMRDALSLTDQAIAYTGSEIQEEQVRQMLGSVDKDHVYGLIDALALGQGQAVIEICEQLREQGLSASQALEDISYVLQRMAVVQFSSNKPQELTDIDPDATRTQALAERMPKDETQLLYSICLKGRSEIGLAPDEYAGLTMILLRLLAFKDTEPTAHQEASEAEAQKKTLDFLASPKSSSVAHAPASLKDVKTQGERPQTTVNFSVEHPVAHPSNSAPSAPSAPSTPPPSSTTSLDSPEPSLQKPSATKRADPSPGAGFNLPVRDMAARPKPTLNDVPPRVTSEEEPEEGYVFEALEDVDRWAQDEAVHPSVRVSPSLSGDSHSQPSASSPPLIKPPPSGAVQVAVRQASQNADIGVSEPKELFKTKLKPSPEGDYWLSVVQQLMSADLIQSLARELALQSQLIAREEDSWLLRIERESLRTVNSVERLSKGLTQLGHAVELRFELAPVQDSPAMRLAQIAFENQQLAEAKILNDPLVIELMQEFDAKIIPGSIKII